MVSEMHIHNNIIEIIHNPLYMRMVRLLLELEFHLYLQADNSNNVCSKRMENEDTN